MNYGSYGASFRFETAPAGRPGASPQAPAEGQARAAAASPAQCPDNLSAYEGSDETHHLRLPGGADRQRHGLGNGHLHGGLGHLPRRGACGGADGARRNRFASRCCRARRAIPARRGTACRA